jgi:hypothetical protein
MYVKDLIEALEKLDPNDLVVIRMNTPEMQYRSPKLGQSTLVEPASKGKFTDAVDRERDRDTTAHIL